MDVLQGENSTFIVTQVMRFKNISEAIHPNEHRLSK